MFIKRTKRTLRGKTYTNHLLVESVATERGPRHRVVCSLSLPWAAPKAQWLKLAHHLQECLGGQESFLEQSAEEQALVQKATLTAKGKTSSAAAGGCHGKKSAQLSPIAMSVTHPHPQISK